MQMRSINIFKVSAFAHRTLGSSLTYQRGFKVFFSSSSLPKYKVIKLPSLSPTMETGNIASWDKKVGEQLEEGDVVAQIETDKAVMAMETPYPGYLAKILKPEGSKDILINDPIGIIVFKETDVISFKDFSFDIMPEAVPTQTVSNNDSSTVTPSKTQIPVEEASRLKVSPYAKKIAEEKSIDISQISGSGEVGRITSKDVLNIQPKIVADVVSKPSENLNYEDIPLTNVRKIIANRLTFSKQTIPHYYLTSEICMDNVAKLRQEFNMMLKQKEIKLSFNDFIIKASSLALGLVPECNSFWKESFIRRNYNVDICVAVSTKTGLLTPFIKDANMKGLVDISSQMKLLANKARENTLKPEEYQGGTFTISNLGMFGINSFSAVINPPQSCILAVGSVDKRLVPGENDQPIVKTFMNVTISCDHRVVDGAVAATWLSHFKNFMENPTSMLL